MKTKFLFTSLLVFSLFFSTAVLAQITATSTGIAIQGIARDANNTAEVEQDISLSFFIYYGAGETAVFSNTDTVTTDAFGVFSYTIVPDASQNAVIANNQCFLRISNGQTVISDETLKTVPYAIAASNGVPTGSIMPFMGNTAPPGWAMCDGTNFSAMPGSEALVALLNSNTTPDLNGLFLRGAGQYDANSVGPAVGDVQDDSYLNHAHGNNISVVSGGGGHGHTLRFSDGGADNSNTGRLPLPADAIGNRPSLGSGEVQGSGTHNHSLTGGVSNSTSGGNETRPVNFGVNYIIKL